MSLPPLCSFPATALRQVFPRILRISERFRIPRLAWFVDAPSLPLFDSESFLPEQLHQALLAHQMCHADDDKNILFAAQ